MPPRNGSLLGATVMGDYFECSKCHRVGALVQGEVALCSMCGSTDGKRVTREEFDKLVKLGVYFDLDSSGKPRKKKRTR